MIECTICKSHNNEQAIFCAECGQRLNPDVNPSPRLHSPLLDSSQPQMPDSSQHQPTANQGFVNLPRPGQPANNNHLHSPLLDDSNIRPDFAQSNNKSTRLHSPVLDGPIQSNYSFESNEIDIPVEEYNSLRSPILAAKVPLPEPVKPIPEAVKAPEPVVKPLPANSPLPASKQPTIQSLFGPIVDSQQAQSEESYKQFATSLFDQPMETEVKQPAPPPARNPASFTTITGIKKEENRDNSLNVAPKTNQSKSISGRGLLPGDQEFAQNAAPVPENARTGFKVTASVILIGALISKFWYCLALGNSLLSSPPFLADQIGQVLIILLLIVLILTAKL